MIPKQPSGEMFIPSRVRAVLSHAQIADLKKWQFYLHRMCHCILSIDRAFSDATYHDISHGYCLDNHGVSDVF